MRHTAQMRDEVNFMNARVDALHIEALSNYHLFPDSFTRVKNQHHKELTKYKVRLEQLVCETDIKEQSKMIFGAFNDPSDD